MSSSSPPTSFCTVWFFSLWHSEAGQWFLVLRSQAEPVRSRQGRTRGLPDTGRAKPAAARRGGAHSGMDGGQSTSTDWGRKHRQSTSGDHSTFNCFNYSRFFFSKHTIISDFGLVSPSHLHVQLQDVRVGLQQLTQVGFGAAEVSVDELFDVTVGWRSGALLNAAWIYILQQFKKRINSRQSLSVCNQTQLMNVQFVWNQTTTNMLTRCEGFCIKRKCYILTSDKKWPEKRCWT